MAYECSKHPCGIRAWRFYLFTSMHSIVRQGAIEAVGYMRNKYLDSLKVSYPAPIDMNKILPPETAQKIIDTIIEKEGGHCSREVLYEITPCAYEHVHKEGYQRIGGIVDADGAYTKINFSHFSESLGVPMNKDLLSEYKIFLGKHLSKSINTRYLTPRISCVDECHEDVFLLAHKNSLGRCMLEKHRDYFKENNIFDFDDYFKWKGYDHQPELHRSRMEDYIKETNRIAEE